MKKFLTLAVILILALLIWNHWRSLFQSGQINKETVHVKVEKPAVRHKRMLPAQQIQLAKPAEGLPRGHLFDENPVIDLIIGLNHFALCLTHLKNKNSEIDVPLSAKQLSYLQPYYDACEAEENAMSLYNYNNIMLKLEGAAKSDRLKMFMKKGVLTDEDWNLIKEWGVDMKAQELLLVSALVERYLYVNPENDLATSLSSRDSRYNNIVVEQGFALLACSKGMDCSHSSGMMLTRCVSDERACGLNYFEYIDEISLMGFKQDLNTTVDWINQTFNL